MMSMLHGLLLAALGVSTIAVAATSAQELSRVEADSMSTKLMRIQETADALREKNAPPVRTSFTDAEVNAYFEYYGPTFLPPGIAEPWVFTADNGRVRARAIVDLDAVRVSRERSLFDPLAFVTGSLEVVATGAVAGTDGWGVVRFESATVAGVMVPKSVAQELLRFYTSTPQRPNGFEFDQPFELPANIRGVALERGRATIIQ
jgi:hypothetical protein